MLECPKYGNLELEEGRDAVEVYSVSERLSWCLMYSAGEIYRTWAPGGGDVGRILHPTLLGSLGYL